MPGGDVSIGAMSSTERRQYVRERLKSDLSAIHATIEATQQSLDRARIIWVAAVVSGTIMIAAVFWVAFATLRLSADDAWIVALIVVVFVAVRLISYKIISHQMKMMQIILKLYSHEANTATLKLLANGVEQDHMGES